MTRISSLASLAFMASESTMRIRLLEARARERGEGGREGGRDYIRSIARGDGEGGKR